MPRKDEMLLYLYTAANLSPAIDYIKKNLLDNPKYSSVEKIYEELKSQNLLPKDPKKHKLMSKDTLNRKLKEHGIYKDTKLKCFKYNPKVEIQFKIEGLSSLLRSLTADAVITKSIGTTKVNCHDYFEDYAYYTLIIGVTPGKENLVAEILMNFSDVDPNTHCIVGWNCIQIGSTNYQTISALHQFIYDLKNGSDSDDEKCNNEDLEDTGEHKEELKK